MRVVIVGGGKVGYQVAKQCTAWGCEVVLVEHDLEKGERIKEELGLPVIIGDGTNPQVLKKAGAEEADIVIAITDDDQDNLVICQLAERQFKARRTLALVNNPGNEKLFRWLGVNQVVGPASLILGLIQETVDIDATTALWMQGIKDLNMIQFKLASDSPALKRKIKEIPFPNECILVTIVRGNSAIVPCGNTVLEAGDLVFALTNPSVQAELEYVLTGRVQGGDGR
ncbi:potassium channel family protein [Moorella sulfitireducens]|uniref:potassium channel family protein n=1 Tax=Neomoorella sulfitireducens TaxID=2972948 RepID=UPI0021AC74CE|nr:TrkA family potassium uptake protein [Moorella sulfitireducens]